MNIIKSDGNYKVESDTKKGKFYLVDINKPNCECPAFKFRKWCKHLEAVTNYTEFENKSKYRKILEVVKEFGPMDSIKLIDIFGEELVNEMIGKGELIEEKGIIRILN